MLRTAIETVDALIAFLDMDGRITKANSSFFSLFRLETNDLTDEFFSEKILSGNPKKEFELFLAEGELNKRYKFQSKFDENGNSKYIDWTALKFADSHKDTNDHIIMTGIDITDNINSERKLLHEKNLLEKILNTSPLGITFVDKNGNLTLANEVAEQVLGLSQSEILERTYDDPDWEICSFDGNPYPEEELPFNIVRKTLTPVFNIEHAIINKEGRKKYLSINSAPILNDQDEFDGMVSTLTDVSELVRNREESEKEFSIEMQQMKNLAERTVSSVTREAFGLMSLKKRRPDAFDILKNEYLKIIEKAMEQKIYKVSHDISGMLKGLAGRISVHKVGPRDIIEMHNEALNQESMRDNPMKKRIYSGEARFLLLELLGYILNIYRNYVTGVIGLNNIETKQK